MSQHTHTHTRSHTRTHTLTHSLTHTHTLTHSHNTHPAPPPTRTHLGVQVAVTTPLNDEIEVLWSVNDHEQLNNVLMLYPLKNSAFCFKELPM